MKTALKLVGYIAGFLLLAAALIALVLYILGLANGNENGSIITTMPPTEDTTPAPDGNLPLENTQQNGTSSVTMGSPTPFLPTPTPVPTPDTSAQPEATPTPSPSPTPVPTPTPEPEPAGTPVGGGTISSDTGAWIDLDAVWSAETVDAEHVKITVTANLRSYRLNTGGRRNGLEMTVDGETTTLDLAAMNVEAEGEVTTELGTYEFQVKAPRGMLSAVPIEVTWHFGGTYGSKQLDKITVSDKVEINRK